MNTKTDCIYKRDSYLTEFSARVLECKELELDDKKAYAVILDLTGFFPEGGGQQSDTGCIDDVLVFDVQEKDGDVIHYLEKPVEEGAIVVCSVDFEKRFSRMQNHSAEHLLCGLIHNKYGFENVGFHLNDECVTFDIDGTLTDDQLMEIEGMANDIVYEDIPIVISLPSAEELKSLEYRSKVEMTEDVRIVTITGIDACACCAPHVKSTGEIGIVHIIDAVPHRGGMRITMLAGRRAYEDYVMLDTGNREIMGIVSAKRLDTADFTRGLDERYKKLVAENTRLKKQMTEYIIKDIQVKIEERAESDSSPFLIFSDSMDDVQLRSILNECAGRIKGISAGFLGGDEEGYRFIATAGDYALADLRGLSKHMSEALDGRGGGSDKMIQGSVKASEKDIRAFFESI